MKLTDYLFKNPITLWFEWLIRVFFVHLSNRKKKIKIGYLTKIMNSTIGTYNTFYNNVLVSNSTIGNFVYVADRTKISNAIIGKFCSIGPDVKIGLGKHPTNFVSTFPAFFSEAKQCQFTFVKEQLFQEYEKVIIGSDVWIGASAIIMDGVKVGDGSIIAAGAVVTKDIEPYSIVGGVPAKIIHNRFDKQICQELLKLKWWDLDIIWLQENYNLFFEPKSFIEKVKTYKDTRN